MLGNHQLEVFGFVLATMLPACGSRSTIAAGLDGGAPPDSTRANDPKPDRTPAADSASPKQGCETDSDCKVWNDCCRCAAILAWESPETCKAACLQSTCMEWGIQQPRAYCIEGHCQIADDTPNSCKTADDCVLYSDCCYCMALPSTANPPPCTAKCTRATCTVEGGVTGKICLAGKCRLAALD